MRFLQNIISFSTKSTRKKRVEIFKAIIINAASRGDSAAGGVLMSFYGFIGDLFVAFFVM